MPIFLQAVYIVVIIVVAAVTYRLLGWMWKTTCTLDRLLFGLVTGFACFCIVMIAQTEAAVSILGGTIAFVVSYVIHPPKAISDWKKVF